MEKGRGSPSQYFVWAVFFAVFLIHLFLAVEWEKLYFLNFFRNSIVFTDAISQAYQKVISLQCHWFDLSIFKELPETSVGKYWPALPSLIGLWMLLVLPVQWLFLLNFFYLAAIMLGIYFSTRFLIGNNFYSMLSAVIFSCYWVVMIQLVAFEVQLAAVACIVWSFYGYLRSCFFTRSLASMLMGLFMILGLYCDRATPGLFVLVLFLVPENFRNKKSWFLMVLVLAIVTVCVWPFYGMWGRYSFRNMAFFARQYNDLTSPLEIYREVLHNPQFLWAHLSYYFISLTEKLLGYGFAGLLIVGMFFLRRLKKPYAQVLWMALLIPFFVFIGIIKKECEYIFPLCIYFAMISGLGIYFIRRRWLRYLLILSVAGLAIGQYFAYFSPSKDDGQFWIMEAQKVPRLAVGGHIGIHNDITEQVRSVIDSVRSLIDKRAQLGERKQAVIIDLKSHFLQHAFVFLLRIDLPRTEIINARFVAPLGTSNNHDEDYLYLLSDKQRDAVGMVPGSGGGFSWKGMEFLYQFPGSDIVLYRVER